jgi:putrescine transport system permease protein
VANFIGNANMFAGRITENGTDHVVVESKDPTCNFYIDHGVSISEGTRVWVSLRPEKIRISKQAPEDSSTNCVRGMVNDIGYLGGTSTYRVLVGDEHIVEVTSPNLNRPKDGNPPIDWDEKTRLLHRLMRLAQDRWRTLVLFVPFAWLLLFFLAPFFIVLKISLAETVIASPPFTPMIEWVDEGIMHIRVVIDNFAYLWEDDLYAKTYLNSLKISSISTILCLLVGYPMAYAIVRADHTTKHVLLMLVILPFWTSFLLRVYAWMGLLADQGTINNLLIAIGIIDEPMRMLYTPFAVYVGIVYTYVPFMILPLYANMEKLDWTLLEAAADLGARPMTTFFTVTLSRQPANTSSPTCSAAVTY